MASLILAPVLALPGSALAEALAKWLFGAVDPPSPPGTGCARALERVKDIPDPPPPDPAPKKPRAELFLADLPDQCRAVLQAP